MNRITKLFQEQKRNILSVYFCAGYPQLDSTVNVIKALEKVGIKIIEIGIPFSDPMADGPVIQQASTVALKNGMTLSHLFSQLKDIRKEVHIPLIFMGYLNPIIQYGFENFCRSSKEVGVDGIILPDLPFKDYQNKFRPIVEKYDLKMIMLITPETSEERIRLIDQNTNGFIYMVSSAAITGAQKDFNEEKLAYFHRINAMNLKNPRMIGFGISNKQTYQSAMDNAAGAIIGSKFIALLEKENGNAEEAAKCLLDELRH
ncbi:MAG: tryptophan synthase subunit alpha [Phocaeicola sp.]|uniref:tryptophan synthase subunit alpha n=1 Tax=Phocaeicola TaxID=909656 RepID=UPI00234EBE95|nr:tryptophan synthase subunit alpha [Phocaeicola oris]MCE2615515.1 tryptophan synthase subunit alpha [Phocaeicola oris]